MATKQFEIYFAQVVFLFVFSMRMKNKCSSILFVNFEGRNTARISIFILKTSEFNCLWSNS